MYFATKTLLLSSSPSSLPANCSTIPSSTNATTKYLFSDILLFYSVYLHIRIPIQPAITPSSEPARIGALWAARVADIIQVWRRLQAGVHRESGVYDKQGLWRLGQGAHLLRRFRQLHV